MTKKKILICDDEAALQQILSEKLTNVGYAVLQAFDGQQALEIAFDQHPDLILLDLIMPKLDGWSFVKKLREDPWGKHVCVIILTNLGNVAEHPNYTHLDIEDYLVKTDWTLDSLVKRVQTCTQQHSQNA